MKKKMLTSLMLSAACLFTMGVSTLFAGAEPVSSPVMKDPEPIIQKDPTTGMDFIAEYTDKDVVDENNMDLLPVPKAEFIFYNDANSKPIADREYEDTNLLEAYAQLVTARDTDEWKGATVNDYSGNTVDIVHVFDVTVIDTDYSHVIFNFAMPVELQEGQTLKVLHRPYGDAEWKEATKVEIREINGKEYARVTFDDLCPVAFLVLTPEAPEAPSVDFTWLIIAVCALLIGLIILFVSKKRK